MSYIIGAFRSRTDTVRFLDFMKRTGIAGSVVNTPKEAMLGCGLSVKFGEADFGKVKQLLPLLGNHTFAGFYRVTRQNNRNITVPVR